MVTALPPGVIGSADGDPDYLFCRIVGVASDGDGVVQVADAIGSAVRAYHAGGAYLSTVGTGGDGPG